MRRTDGITLIGIYQFFVAGLSLLGALALGGLGVFLLVGAPMIEPEGQVSMFFVGMMFFLAAGITLVAGAINLICGIGLWKLRPWSRICVIVLSALRVFNVPVGTVIGGLTIWYLLKPDVEALFKA